MPHPVANQKCNLVVSRYGVDSYRTGKSGTDIGDSNNASLLSREPALDIHGGNVRDQNHHTIRYLEECCNQVRVAKPLND